MKQLLLISLFFLSLRIYAQTDAKDTCTISFENSFVPSSVLMTQLCGYISKNEDGKNGRTGFEERIFGYITSSGELSDELFSPCVKAWIEKYYEQLIVRSSALPPCSFSGHVFNAFAKENYRTFWNRMLIDLKIDVNKLNTPVQAVVRVNSVDMVACATPLDITEHYILRYENTAINRMNDLITTRDQLIAYGVKNSIDLVGANFKCWDDETTSTWSPSEGERKKIEEIAERTKKAILKAKDDDDGEI
ncbi:MAG: hypothetical protein RLN90_14600 [Balneolaceae bacterium]